MDNYLIELGLMISRIEHKLNLDEMTEKEEAHYLAHHYGDSFIKDLKKHHKMLVEGRGSEIIGPDVISFEVEGSGDSIDSIDKVMTYSDLVSN